MTSRPLHAVLVAPGSGERLLDLLAAALDGSGPAVLPLDAGWPERRLAELVAAFAPTTIETPEDPTGVTHLASHTADHGVAEDVCAVLATSGSTGRPKGAELTCAALTASAHASLARLGATEGERWLCALPTHHISGLGVLVRSLISGTTPVFAGRLDADAVAAAGCDYVSVVPTQLRRLLDEQAPVRAFRAILLGGAAIPPGMLAQAAAAGGRVVTSYGMTETSGGCVYDGLPLDGVQVTADPGGRLRIGGPVLFSRYRLDSAQTAAVIANGCFVTSDLGDFGPDGRLYIRGRADDVITTGGEKVIPGEVEAALRGCDWVRDVVVVGVPDEDWGELVTAVIVPADPAVLPTLRQAREAVLERLPRYAAPRALAVVPELAMLRSGKPDRRLLRERVVSGDLRHAYATRETN